MRKVEEDKLRSIVRQELINEGFGDTLKSKLGSAKDWFVRNYNRLKRKAKFRVSTTITKGSSSGDELIPIFSIDTVLKISDTGAHIEEINELAKKYKVFTSSVFFFGGTAHIRYASTDKRKFLEFIGKLQVNEYFIQFESDVHVSSVNRKQLKN